MDSESNISDSKLGVIILAGGFSSRMNYPKAWLPYNESESFLSHIVNEYEKFGCKKIVVVLNNQFFTDRSDELSELREKATVVKNLFPGNGRTFSIQLALEHVDELDFAFIHNVDNPFVESETLKRLSEERNVEGFTSPRYLGKGGHPILLSKKVISKLSKYNPQRNLKEILAFIPRIQVEVEDESILYNINTPADYEQYFQDLLTA